MSDPRYGMLAHALKQMLDDRERRRDMNSKRYSVMVRELANAAVDVELCQCDSNPQGLVEVLRDKRAGSFPRYARVWVRDNLGNDYIAENFKGKADAV